MTQKIAELFKVMAIEAVESQKPTTILFGRAESDDEIVIEQRMRLKRRSLCFMNGARFQKGDKVILLREHGGQNFVVLGTIE